MPRPISKRQLQANRKNAKKSTGPRSRQGKSRTTARLLRRGLLAKEVVIKHGHGAERKAAFNALLAALCIDLKPQGPVEEMLVERIATSYWRMRRALRYEIGAIRDLLDDCRDDAPDKETSALHKRLRTAEQSLADERETLQAMASPLDLADPRTFDLLTPTLQQLKADHDLPPTQPPPTADFRGPLLPSRKDLEARRDRQRASFLNALQQANLTGQALQDALRAAQEKVVAQCEAEVNHWRRQLDSARRNQELRRDRRALAGCLPDDDRVLRLVRYETMLDCQLHRALSELRRRRLQTQSPQ